KKEIREKKSNIARNIIFLMMFLLIGIHSSFASLELNYIHFDPAIIASGDEVDIVIEFESKNLPFADDKIGGSGEYSFKVKLLADDDLSKNNVMILDSEGDDLKGSVIAGEKYYKKFRVKINSDAPAANYEFKLEGRWYKNDKPLDIIEELRFKIPVKKEGIIIDLSSIQTSPSQIRAGDKFVELKTYIENVGEKNSKSLEIILENIDYIEPSYSNNNRIWLGSLGAGESKEVIFYVNIDNFAKGGVYNLNFNITYMDLDDNSFSKINTLPLLIKKKPYLEIEKVEGNGLAGKDSKLYVWVKNIGEESAESVDIRILKQNSQPFEFEARSSYIGELEVNESGLAIFDIEVLSNADIKNHDFKLLIRAKGDSDEGDDTIYTFNRRASFEVTGTSPNYYLIYGVFGLILLIIIFTVSKFGGKKKK
ncbi:MAG: COG1361 S-layer family protein, partial [Nanoarchaeota archaeon]|nr:COG1361 S-layer family protein [Nanoarchaeota archaeon]